MTPAQQAASDALGLAVLATGRAKRALDALGNEAVAFIGGATGGRSARGNRRQARRATEWCAAFDAWRDAHRAEARARAKLAALLELAEAVDAAEVAAEEFAILDTTANGRALERARDIAGQCLADYRAARDEAGEVGDE